jgi:hypothetical protein
MHVLALAVAERCITFTATMALTTARHVGHIAAFLTQFNVIVVWYHVLVTKFTHDQNFLGFGQKNVLCPLPSDVLDRGLSFRNARVILHRSSRTTPARCCFVVVDKARARTNAGSGADRTEKEILIGTFPLHVTNVRLKVNNIKGLITNRPKMS